MNYIIIIAIILVIFTCLFGTYESYKNIGKRIDYPYYNRHKWIIPNLWYNSVTPLPFNNPTRFYGRNYLYPLIQDYYYPRISFY